MFNLHNQKWINNIRKFSKNRLMNLKNTSKYKLQCYNYISLLCIK